MVVDKEDNQTLQDDDPMEIITQPQKITF